MKITDYVRETKAEMSHVTWPSRRQAIAYSALVVIASLATAGFLGAFDYGFSKLLALIIQ